VTRLAGSWLAFNRGNPLRRKPWRNQIGHNRQPVEGGPDARYARPRSERIRLDTLVDGYTINGAYQLGRSHELGSIEVGKQADLVILNQNLFEVNRYDVHKTKPVAVIMDGELVHGEL